MEQQPHNPSGEERRGPGESAPNEVPIDGTALEQVTAYLHLTFADADSRGEVIARDDAQVIATLLAPLLGPNSAIARFAETGDLDPAALDDECRRLKARTQHIPNVDIWIERLEQHISARTANAANHQPSFIEESSADQPRVAQGIREHGDAFRAYLQLPDTARDRDDLLATFDEFYVGSFDSIDALLNELTDVRTLERALKILDHYWGVEGLVSLDRDKVEDIARQVWDVVGLGDQFHVFKK